MERREGDVISSTVASLSTLEEATNEQITCDNCESIVEVFILGLPKQLRVDRLCYKAHDFCVQCWKDVVLDPAQGSPAFTLIVMINNILI